MTELVGRPCVVTGASRGIGRALAERLATLGAPLAVCARSAPAMEEAAASLGALGAPAVLARALDVSDAAAVRDFASASERMLGPVYAVVNNAAVLGPVGRIDAVDVGAWRDALVTNVVGAVTVTHAFVGQLEARGGGRVVNLSGGGTGGPGVAARISAYTASKSAVVSLTETLAAELAPVGITVNAVAPGAQATGFGAAVFNAGPEVAGAALYDQTRRQQDAPDPIAPFLDLVSFLLSDEAGWLTGKLLSARWDPVDSLRARRAALESTSLLNLRRIDDALYTEVDHEVTP